MTKLYGSLEAGGTKFVCAVGDEKFEIVEKTQFPTTTPIETLDKTIEFFSRFDNLAGLAVGSFGPIDIDQNSKTYGSLRQLQSHIGQMWISLVSFVVLLMYQFTSLLMLIVPLLEKW